jgi:hypothetical protein
MAPYQSLLEAVTGDSFDNISSTILYSGSPTAAPYAEWIQLQVRNFINRPTTANLERILRGDNGSANDTLKEATADENGLILVLTEVAKLLNASESWSIDALARALVEKRVLKPYADKSNEQKEVYRLIFIGIGWLCLLYLPTFGIAESEFRFDIEVEGKNCFSLASQSIDRARRPFAEVLRGFGSVLPRRKEDNDIRHASQHSSSPSGKDILNVSMMNAATLWKVGGIRISWTATVSAHLDFDEETRTLSLFRLPSFCVINSSNRALFSK